jgi:Fe-Mn family superoxide dismutase
MVTRRDMLRAAAGGAVLFAVPKAAPAQDKGGFTLPKLPYAYDALEPHIDARTMEIHHGKHHQAYVDNLNKALGGKTDKSLEELLMNLKALPAAQQTAVRNNGGGHWNHTFFWGVMSKSGGQPSGDLLKAIDASFGSVDGFKKEFKAKALAQFGSGWAWLVKGSDKPLAVVTTANQDNALMLPNGPQMLLGVDVWEHAYYLKYQNKRADYVDAWFNVINWAMVAEHFARRG